jgi:hypothetical protein
MITSRFLDSISTQIGHSMVLEIQASNSDVRKYVKERISTENRLCRHVEKDPALGEAIIAKVVANAQKM